MSHHKLNVTVVTLCRLLRGGNCKILPGDFLESDSPLFTKSVGTLHYLVALFSNYLRTGALHLLDRDSGRKGEIKIFLGRLVSPFDLGGWQLQKRRKPSAAYAGRVGGSVCLVFAKHTCELTHDVASMVN